MLAKKNASVPPRIFLVKELKLTMLIGINFNEVGEYNSKEVGILIALRHRG